jgi:lipoprotein-anchoring transpeptidase ErfK/SrfK
MTVEAGKMVVVASRIGETVDRAETTTRLEEALTAGVKSVELAVTYTEPTVAEADLGTAILVDISERHLYLYDKGALVKDYGVAVGTGGHPTPTGNYRITLKRYMPTWSNPGSAWAAGMPSSIPPGPNNPLGTRALNIDAPGIRIHGTNKDGSIGTAASHGCMRMHRWDIEDLYERVEVGTPVFIVR